MEATENALTGKGYGWLCYSWERVQTLQPYFLTFVAPYLSCSSRDYLEGRLSLDPSRLQGFGR